jgi:hypothetical protein
MTVRWLRPGSAEYEATRRPAMPRYGEIRPAAIAQCASSADVAEVLEEARNTGVPVVPRSGGHCFAGRSSTTGIVLDVSPMTSVDVIGQEVCVGAGARLNDLYDALDAAGVTIPAGCGPTVGIAGLPYRQLKRSFVGLGADDEAVPKVEVSKSEFFAQPLPTAVIEKLVRTAPGEVNFTPMGGAYNRVPADATAFAHRDTAFLLELMASAPAVDLEATEIDLRAQLAEVFKPLEPFGTGRVYPNFPDPTLKDPLTAYHGENLDRLLKVKQTYDPDGFFAFPQSLSPAAS